MLTSWLNGSTHPFLGLHNKDKNSTKRFSKFNLTYLSEVICTKPSFDANPQIKDMIASQTALGRVGVPDNIAGVVAFWCLEDARWVNGQRLEVSGGIFL
ncbi:MAG: SDR family oxidoreductase [Desulfobacterales bacterium]|jgi:NAD(P)-dependent dehydrogenase (short-subunit alcohol dehydrogenase family)